MKGGKVGRLITRLARRVQRNRTQRHTDETHVKSKAALSTGKLGVAQWTKSRSRPGHTGERHGEEQTKLFRELSPVPLSQRVAIIKILYKRVIH